MGYLNCLAASLPEQEDTFLHRGYHVARRSVKIELSVWCHLVEQRVGDHRLHSSLGHAAESAMLLQAVLQQHIAIGQAARVQVVQQPVTLRVEGHLLYVVIVHAPLPEEPQCPHLVGHFHEAHDVLPPSFQEGGERTAVEAHEARQRTYINVPARVLPQSLGLHLGQSVLRDVSSIGEAAFHLPAKREAEKESRAHDY